MSEEPISEAFASVLGLAVKLGVTRINEREGCWEHAIDGTWWIAINGHKTPTKCSRGPEVPFGHCYVEYNGFPAGVFSMRSGIIAAGAAANEATFIAAVQRACDALEIELNCHGEHFD